MTLTHGATVQTSDRCDDIVTLRVSRPKGFDFVAGQWIRLGVKIGAEWSERTLSLASAPGDPWIEVATRLSDSEFKRTLATLTSGDEVLLSGPGGRTRLDSEATRLAFLVGGVGITPARSYLRAALQSGHVFDDALLFYGNRGLECIPFQAELHAMAGSGVKVIDVPEHAPESWTGARGFIDAALVRRHLHEDDGRPFFVAGPPVMVAAMECVLDELEIGRERRVIERFGPVTNSVG